MTDRERKFLKELRRGKIIAHLLITFAGSITGLLCPIVWKHCNVLGTGAAIIFTILCVLISLAAIIIYPCVCKAYHNFRDNIIQREKK